MIDDVRAPYVFANMKRRELKMRNAELALLVQDHAVATFPHLGNSRVEFADATRNAAREFGLRLFDVGAPSQGISHVAAPESGFVIPGASLYQRGQSRPDGRRHRRSRFWLRQHGNGACAGYAMRVDAAAEAGALDARSEPAPGVTAKDIVLHALAVFGRETFRGMALEFAGAVSHLSVEARMTLCNMAVEMGARTALVAPDENVLAWLEARAGQTITTPLRDANALSSLHSGDEAKFDIDVKLDCPAAPQITWGTSPAQTMALDGIVPQANDTGSNAPANIWTFRRAHRSWARRSTTCSLAPAPMRVSKILQPLRVF